MRRRMSVLGEGQFGSTAHIKNSVRRDGDGAADNVALVSNGFSFHGYEEVSVGSSVYLIAMNFKF